jgi:hypothetical protein
MGTVKAILLRRENPAEQLTGSAYAAAHRRFSGAFASVLDVIVVPAHVYR